jgi:hypothetical protein
LVAAAEVELVHVSRKLDIGKSTLEPVDGSKRVGANQQLAQFVLRGIGNRSVVRSTADGHDAHAADLASYDSSKDDSNVADRNIDFHYSDRTGIKRGRCSGE